MSPDDDHDDDDDDDDDYDVDDHEYYNFYDAVTQHMPLQGRLDNFHVTCQRHDLIVVCFEFGLERVQGGCRSYGCWNVVPAPRSGNRKGAITETGLRFSNF